MGHRDVKRVPLDFDWPLNKVWDGYLNWEPCDRCDGDGDYEGEQCHACLGDGGTNDIVDPPEGDGWQLWETTSEGSPVSPVMGSAAELADWCAEHATVFASMKATYTEWYRMITGDTLDVDSLGVVSDEGLTFLGRLEPPR